MNKKILTLGLVLISIISMGCTKSISEEDLQNIAENSEEYFNEENMIKRMNEKTKKTDGNYSIYSPYTTSKEDGEISKAFPDSFVDVYEFNLEEGKSYNIEIFSEYYEKDVLKNREELFNNEIKVDDEMYILNDSRHDASKRELLLHFVTKDKIIESVEYYLPANWNQCGFLFNDAFDDKEIIPLIVYERGVKGKDGKYKTASSNLTLDGEKREKSINKAMKKNAQTVIIKMKVSQI